MARKGSNDVISRQNFNIDHAKLFICPLSKKLIKIFPDLNAKKMLIDFTGQKTFLWVKDKLSPEQRQAVHEIGEPGLMYGPREMRLYPNGRLAAHILGGVGYGKEGVSSAELVGSAGVELKFDDFLKDKLGKGEPLILSLDLP